METLLVTTINENARRACKKQKQTRKTSPITEPEQQQTFY